MIKFVCFDFIFAETESVDSSPPVAERTQFVTVSVDLRVSRIYRRLTATPSFGGQIAGAGGTPRLTYLPCQTMELPLDGDNTKDS